MVKAKFIICRAQHTCEMPLITFAGPPIVLQLEAVVTGALITPHRIDARLLAPVAAGTLVQIYIRRQQVVSSQQQ